MQNKDSDDDMPPDLEDVPEDLLTAAKNSYTTSLSIYNLKLRGEQSIYRRLYRSKT